MVDYLRGDDYRGLCGSCRMAINRIAELYRLGILPDDGDPEAPMIYVVDNMMGCVISNLTYGDCPGNITEAELHRRMQEPEIRDNPYFTYCHCNDCRSAGKKEYPWKND